MNVSEPPDEKVDKPCCNVCGKEADVVIDGIGWCAGCYHARGSCCAESEMDEEP